MDTPTQVTSSDPDQRIFSCFESPKPRLKTAHGRGVAEARHRQANNCFTLVSSLGPKCSLTLISLSDHTLLWLRLRLHALRHWQRIVLCRVATQWYIYRRLLCQRGWPFWFCLLSALMHLDYHLQWSRETTVACCILQPSSIMNSTSSLLFSVPDSKPRFARRGSRLVRISRPSRPRWVFCMAIPGLVVTTALSATLLYWNLIRKTFGNDLLRSGVVNNRATVQLVVQILSQLLGLTHMCVLTRLFIIFTVRILQNRCIILDCLRWWNSMCYRQLETRCIYATLFFWPSSSVSASATSLLPQCWQQRSNDRATVFSLAPAALWADALTPVVTNDVVNGNFSIPYYGLDP